MFGKVGRDVTGVVLLNDHSQWDRSNTFYLCSSSCGIVSAKNSRTERALLGGP